ncbi:MAG: hypothetical protein CMA12_07725 [Euryarchaeota archaeon]|nr:hypothetical protein [Euryarchaeota archaeon]MAZ07578.1 hypothetical protein [Rickettsiales bacterium]OUU12518.1 MAG: hypothetical protein CBB94_00170 [Gammaproteobacteria bacterium TMED34]
MRKKIKSLLRRISRVIYLMIPIEYKSKLTLQKKINDNLVEETFDNFKEHFKKSLILDDTWDVREYAIKTAVSNDKNNEFYNLEFGVYQGTSANYFSKYVKKLYAFDGFQGLKEDWLGTNQMKGSVDLNKKVPKLNSNVEPIVGWVEDTLEDFLEKHNPKINFVHLDMDTYNPTKFTLERIKPYLVKNAIILFDELYNYVGWQHGEYKALKEVFRDDEFEYKAFALNSVRCAIQIK